MRTPTWIPCLCLALTTSLVAQCPPGAEIPNDHEVETTVADRGPAWSRWQSGKESLAAGDLPTARQHLLAALEFHPAALPLLFDLLLASGADSDQQHLAADRYALAAADAQGRFDFDAAQRRAVAALPGLQDALDLARKTALARSAAIADLARVVDRNKPQGQKNAARAVLVHWASRVLLTLGTGSPKVLAAVEPAVNKVQAAFRPDFELVLSGLQRVLQQRVPKIDGEADEVAPARALRAARLLVGLQRQGSFKDLQGPPPRDLGSLADAAAKLLAQCASERAASARVWTIAELEQLDGPASEQFTNSHADWSTPGVALSSTGRYRIETCCGYHTLLEVASTIERHHERLAAHCGSDPFAKRPGLVQIVPEHHDLETEGVPYWWAGGFQSGDRTVVRFAWSRGPQLGRTLTHELTHRFDGVLRPFLGGWYGEGHAQWTAASYAMTADATFVEDTLDVHPAAMTFYKGYGEREKFGKLLQGTIEDYRDNYDAGCSLYTFLRSFPLGTAKYRDQLARFEQNARGGQKDPVGYFTQCFCDGKAGRPASLDAFVIEWSDFLRGCYEWNDDKKTGNEWVGAYARPPRGEVGPLVLDAPTWSWARERAEPWFGQDHAAAATRLLHEVGDAPATVAAGVWSLTVDGWRPDTARALLAALRTQGPADAAQALAAMATARFPALPTLPATQLLDVSKATRNLLAALAARTEALRDSAPHAAAASAAEHDQLALLLGQPPLPPQVTVEHPLPRHLASDGLLETSLTGFDELRQPGLWYATPDGDLHVGRERPRDGTGTLDREAHRRDAFVRCATWQAPGEYVVRARVHFTTSYVDGAIVFGHTRRDRDLRLHFEAGDQQYAIGKREQDTGRGQLALRLQGLWERDGQLPDTGPQRVLDLPSNQTWFDVVLRVRAARVEVAINGEPVMRYAMHDGAAIEGQIGIAMANGAVRVQAPTVQRLDGANAAAGLDLGHATTATLDDLLQLPVRGLVPGPDGTFVLWLPPPNDAAQQALDRLPGLAELLAELMRDAHLYPQDWLLAVPRETTAADRQRAQATLQPLRAAMMPVVEHAVAGPFDGSFPWILFVDGGGLLRAAAVVTDPQVHIQVRRWARMLRAR
jgi:hypothetical protein